MKEFSYIIGFMLDNKKTETFGYVGEKKNLSPMANFIELIQKVALFILLVCDKIIHSLI